jgi:hypothetical protein
MAEEFTTEDLIEELQKLHPPIRRRQAGEGVTIMEWSKAQGVGDRRACEQLRNLMQEGKLTRQKMRCADGMVRWVYTIP